MNPLQQVYLALKTVLKERKYFLIFLITAVAFFGLFIIIPITTIPGNNFLFQLSIFRPRDYILMVFLAFLVSLTFAFQMYIWRQLRTNRNLSRTAFLGTASGILGIFGAIVGTAACGSCLIFLFSLIGLGAGSVLFVFKNQPYLLFGAIVLMLVSLYYLARKVNKVCTSC